MKPLAFAKHKIADWSAVFIFNRAFFFRRVSRTVTPVAEMSDGIRFARKIHLRLTKIPDVAEVVKR